MFEAMAERAMTRLESSRRDNTRLHRELAFPRVVVLVFPAQISGVATPRSVAFAWQATIEGGESCTSIPAWCK